MPDLSVIIPAAGAGYRTKSYGPKSLIEVDGVSLLENQLKSVKSISDDVTVVVGFKYAKLINIIPENVRVVYNNVYQTTNVAYSINLALPCKYEKVLIIYSDLIYLSDIFKRIKFNESFLLIDKHDLFRREEVGCVINENEVSHMSFGLEKKWCHIMYLQGKELDLFKSLSKQQTKLFGFEVINQIIDNGGKFKAITSNRRVYELDTAKQIKHIKEIYERIISGEKLDRIRRL